MDRPMTYRSLRGICREQSYCATCPVRGEYRCSVATDGGYAAPDSLPDDSPLLDKEVPKRDV